MVLECARCAEWSGHKGVVDLDALSLEMEILKYGHF